LLRSGLLRAGLSHALTLLILYPSLALAAPESGTATKPDKTPRAASNLRRLKGCDITGKLHRLGERESTRGVVVVFLATQCPISNAYIPLLNKLATMHQTKGIEVYGAISNPGVTRADAARHHREYQLRFPVLFDASGDLRSSLKPTHTPEVFLLDREGKVLYQGAVDNRYAAVGRKKQQATEHYLLDAVAATLSGRPISVKSSKPIGCLLEDAPSAAASGKVTFNRDIAPILFANCSRCHRPDQAAPFSLLTYADASRHAKQIVEVTKSRLMPPWKAVPGINHFKDERRLTDAEIELIAEWVADGKAEGDPADLPPAPEFPKGWQLGTPDLILRMPQAFEVPASGPDVLQHFVLPTGQEDMRLVSAVEFQPGNPRVVHHASFFLDNHGYGRKLDHADPGIGYGGGGGPGFFPVGTLRSWLPGMTPRPLPEGSGRIMPRNSDLVLEIHYQCSGKPEKDQSTVGLYFAPPRSRRLIAELQLFNFHLEIPPGEARHRHSASYTLPANAIILDCAPHMHLLGREMKATATLPDGTTQILMWVKDWNFNWQEQYEYLEPIRLPKGTRIDVDAWYDNSTDNPLNPFSPPQLVRWGDQTTDEMGICHFHFTCDTMQELATINLDYSERVLAMIKEMRNMRFGIPIGDPSDAASAFKSIDAAVRPFNSPVNEPIRGRLRPRGR